MLGLMCLVALLQLLLLFPLVLSWYFLLIGYVFSYVQCVLLVDWRCFANVLWCCNFEIAPKIVSMCVGVSVRLGWGCIRVAGLKHNSCYTDTTPNQPHRNSNTHRNKYTRPM